MNTNKTVSKEENIRRCLRWAEFHKAQGNKAGELLWLQRSAAWNLDELRGEEPMPPVMVKLEGRPKRDTIINADDIVNIRIMIERGEI